MSGYFSFFPTMVYANTAAVNLIAKVQFDEAVLKRKALYHPYTIENGERAEQIADMYYGKPSYDWVIYMSNGITDPHHEWPKLENEFQDFIKIKYGSMANSQQQTAFYQNNYSDDERVISASAYAALSQGQKKYWMPILNINEEVINYQRKPLDTVVETNQVVMLTGRFTNTPRFTENEVIKQSNSVMGTVCFTNTTCVMLKHVTGTWEANTTIYRVSTGVGVSKSRANVISSSIISQNIPLEEITYWSPVNYLQYEANINESRKYIRLLSASYIDAIERDMKDLL